MITLNIKEKEIEITNKEDIIRGTVGVSCKVIFDDFWQDYEKTLVFKRDERTPINVIVSYLTSVVEIPPEILDESGKFKIGAFGVSLGKVSPTLWGEEIKILYGTDTHGTSPKPFTPTEIDQLRVSKQDKLTPGDNIIIDENNVISARGGGAGGTTDYNDLENKPKINGVELNGDMQPLELGLVGQSDLGNTVDDVHQRIARAEGNIENVENDLENLQSGTIQNLINAVNDNRANITTLQKNIGNIDTALDTIIEIQNSLIGGGNE